MSHSTKKRVLIITYYWPPAGGPGVQRVLKFVKYLPQFGWEPIVLTVENGEYPALDESLLKEVPADVRVYRTNTIEPFALYKRMMGKEQSDKIDTYVLDGKQQTFVKRVMSWIRSNLFIPDARVGWKRYAVAKGLTIIKEESIDMIFTSSPPHSVQLIGQSIKRKTGLPWIADYRDPWVDAFWEQGEQRVTWAQRRFENQERQSVTASSEIISVSRPVLNSFKRKYSDIKVNYIPNGYDPDDFIDIQPVLSDTFKIVYTGSIAPSQVPDKFLSFLKEMEQSTEYSIEFLVFGAACAEFIRAVSEIGLSEVVSFRGYVEHSVALSHVCGADMLLLLIPEGRSDILTGKLFDYLGAKRPILCIGPKGEASEIVHSTGRGIHFDYSDSIDKSNIEYFENWNNEEAMSSIIDTFSRKNQTQELVEIFDRHVRK